MRVLSGDYGALPLTWRNALRLLRHTGFPRVTTRISLALNPGYAGYDGVARIERQQVARIHRSPD
jgi:hypothetical protein